MALLTKHALRVTAALIELKNANEDVLDALVPFFEPILAVMNNKVFDPTLLAAGVQRLYRWKFTKDVAEQFIPRLLRKGYLRREGTREDALYVVTFANANASPAAENVARSLSRIVERFEEFTPRLTDLLHYKKTRDELTDILVRFLVSIDAYAEGVLADSAKLLKDEPAEARQMIETLEEGGQPLSREDRYIAARFVDSLCQENADFATELTRIAAVGLLTEVVEDFVRPTGLAVKSDLTIVVDAPVALDYLGLSGRALQQDVRAVFDPLRKIGCRFVVFPITCEEMQRNLKGMLALSPPSRHGYTHSAMVKGEVMAEVVEAVARNPESALENVGIGIRQLALDQFPGSHQHFPAKTYEDFLSTVTWVADIEPRVHDATCLALLMRLRQGKQSSDLFRAGFIFVTRNVTYARRSRKYCVESRLLADRQEPPIIHQRELATVAWLRTGLDAEGSIPRANLMASCERVLQLRPEVTRAVAAKLQQVTTPEKIEQFELLLRDQRSIRKLADTTLNDERVVTADNAEHLLELMRQATAVEERERYETALKEQRAAHRESQGRQREKQNAALAEKQARLDEREAELVRTAVELDEARANLRTVEARRSKAIVDVVALINRRTMLADRAATAVLIALGLLSVIDIWTGVLTDQPIWGYGLKVGGIVGIYYVIVDFLQKPKIGLGNGLSWWALRMFKKAIRRKGLEPPPVTGLSVANGQLRWRAQP